jgi:hypothetical protein
MVAAVGTLGYLEKEKANEEDENNNGYTWWRCWRWR